MKLSLWVYYFAIADRSVMSLSSTFSFLVVHPLLILYFVAPFPQVSPHVGVNFRNGVPQNEL